MKKPEKPRAVTLEHLPAGEIRYECASGGKHLVRYRPLEGPERPIFIGPDEEAWKVYKAAADDLAEAARKRAELV